MFGFKIYYRKKTNKNYVLSEVYYYIVALYSRLLKSCSDLLGLKSHPSQSLYSFLFQVFDNVLLNLKVMKLKVGVHSPLNQALNQSLLDDFFAYIP